MSLEWKWLLYVKTGFAKIRLIKRTIENKIYVFASMLYFEKQSL